MRYSIFSLLSRTLAGHRGWQPMWRDAAPRMAYDVVIIGGGGHGLATAHYLASDTASAMSPCWRKAGSAAAMSAVTPRSSAPTICCRETSRSMNCR